MIITEPTVTVLAVPTFMPHSGYQIPDGDDTPSERLITHAGKGCYDAYGKGGRSVKEHIAALIESGHGSVLEHASFSLFIEGISRGCSHEFVRHRAGFAYSQRSTRYVDEGECNIVLEPWQATHWKAGSAEGRAIDEFVEHCHSAISFYRGHVVEMMEFSPKELNGRDRRKWARGKARQALPIAIETRMTVTANLRAWRHFIVMRSGRGAEMEIRRLAFRIFETLEPYAPHVFADMTTTWIAGFPEYTSLHPKV